MLTHIVISYLIAGGIFECLLRPLRRVWRLLCCRRPEETGVCLNNFHNIKIKLSVEETSPLFSGHSSVRPWWRSSGCLSSLRWDDNIEWRPDKQLKFWTYILKSSLKDWEDGYTSPQIIGPAVRHVRPSYWHEMCFCCQNVMCNGQGTLSLLPAQVVTVCASFSAILFKRLDSLIFTVAKLTVVHKQTQVDWFRSMQGGIRSLAR